VDVIPGSLNEAVLSSSSTTPIERDYGTAPHPLTWKANESLLILIPQTFISKIL